MFFPILNSSNVLTHKINATVKQFRVLRCGVSISVHIFQQLLLTYLCTGMTVGLNTVLYFFTEKGMDM